MRWPSWLVKQAGAPPPAMLVNGAQGVQISLDRQSNEMLREYVRNIYLWRSVDMIAQMSSAVALEVYSANEQLTSEASNVAKLLRKPNPQWSPAALQYFMAASLAVANRTFLKRVRGVAGVTQELWPLNANEVTVKYEPGSRMIQAFELEPANGRPRESFPVNENGDSDIIFIHKPALNSQTDRSPASIAAPPAEVFTRILQRCADIVSNSANISGLLSTESDILKPALQEMKDKLSEFKLRGSQSGDTLLSSNARWSFTRLSEDPNNALSVSIKDSLARDVIMTFGVPTQLVGIPGTDTYANLVQARVGFLTDTVLPGYINLYVAALNLALLPSNGAIIRPDIAKLPVMVQGRLQLVETAAKATMLSVNEQRALLGYPPHDDPMSDIPVTTENLARQRLQVEVFGGHITGGGADARAPGGDDGMPTLPPPGNGNGNGNGATEED